APECRLGLRPARERRLAQAKRRETAKPGRLQKESRTERRRMVRLLEMRDLVALPLQEDRRGNAGHPIADNGNAHLKSLGSKLALSNSGPRPETLEYRVRPHSILARCPAAKASHPGAEYCLWG